MHSTRMVLHCLCLVALFVLCGCASQANRQQVQPASTDIEVRKQKEWAVRDVMTKREQLDRVAWTLLEKNAYLCGRKISWQLGFTLVDGADFPKDRELNQEALGVEIGRPVVLLVSPGSPAEVAGARKGDIVLKIDGQRVLSRKNALVILNNRKPPYAPVTITLERAGNILDLSMTPVQLCDSPIEIVDERMIQTYTNGSEIAVSTGMLAFIQSDDELATILGHDVAHNILGHEKILSANDMVANSAGFMFLALARLPLVSLRAGSYSPEQEREADSLGLYFTARAGYNIGNVSDLWRRLAVGGAGSTSTDYASVTSARVMALEATRDEILVKQKAGQKLQPGMRGGL